LEGFTPTIDLSLGYRKGNDSVVLKMFLARVGELGAGIGKPVLLDGVGVKMAHVRGRRAAGV
jgi:hypothetical protein